MAKVIEVKAKVEDRHPDHGETPQGVDGMDAASWLGQCLWAHANTIPDRHSQDQAWVNPGRCSGDGDLPKATARFTRAYRHAGIADGGLNSQKRVTWTLTRAL